ncbi:hypothetical protein ABII15_33550 [Streptomyces sp. HUAS MG91]|uniref:Uncharacterized protein n=1 Tax=Streptomyces tabacisoli TaxID=3156398 RepID=A0AAU8J3Q3_9ACTN
MTPRTPRAAPADRPEHPTERRLHAALAARADSITVRTLRPAEPPGPHLRRLPLLHHGRRRYALALAGLATAAALVVGLLTRDTEPHRTPVPPAAPSAPADPDRGSTPPSPAPSDSRTPGTAVPSPSGPAYPTRPGGTGPTATPSTPG